MNTDPTLCTCGCCEGVHVATPIEIDNAPGLSALAYRVGTYGTFNESMHALLDGEASLAGLKTRESGDPTIAMIDAWSVVLDVLTFYQERIANEGYLRTATERLSLLDLAREIGYELRPGVAASTVLAFTLETAQGAPSEVDVPIGAKAQSVPGPGEQPQTFESIEAITARPEWNAMHVRIGQPQQLIIAQDSVRFAADASAEAEAIYLVGTNSGLAVGDLLLFVNADGSAYALRDVLGITTDTARQTTRVAIASNSVDAPVCPTSTAYVDRDFLPGTPALPLTDDTLATTVLADPLREEDLQTYCVKNNWAASDVVAAVAAIVAARSLAGQTVLAFRDKAAFFGNNAPAYRSLRDKDNNPLYQDDWDTNGWPIWEEYVSAPYSGAGSGLMQLRSRVLSGGSVGSGRLTTAPLTMTYAPPYVPVLERTINGLAAGTWVVLETSSVQEPYRLQGTWETSLAAFSMSGKGSALQLRSPANGAADERSEFLVRTTTAHVNSAALTLAPLPLDEEIAAATTSLALDRMYAGLQTARLVALTGEQYDAPGVMRTEILVLEEIIHDDGVSTIQFHTLTGGGLQYAYRRSTVVLNANAARATHGETKSEIVGSGDASQQWQSFTLKQSPLTYVSAATASGSASTLAIRVNDILWNEARDFYSAAARDAAFITRRTDDAKTIVTFGEGEHGRRVATGVENISAAYRVGSGVAGNVPAGQISSLLTRPPGLKGAVNPVPAEGGADAESRDSARVNAPLTVMTLDRIVSLQDFEDFTRGFAGIGKALATWLWDGDTKLVHVTVGGAEGAAVDPTSDLAQNLLNGIDAARDPVCRVVVASYEALAFRLEAQVLVNAAYIAATVLADVRAALIDAFSFAARRFGQGVSASEVYAIMQTVDGVDAVDIKKFYLVTNPSTNEDMLPAQTARWTENPRALRAAQLLGIDTFGITLSEMHL